MTPPIYEVVRPPLAPPDFGRRPQMRGAYRGADRTAWEAAWDSQVGAPDELLRGDIELLRARGEDLARNNAWIQGAEQTILDGVLGSGMDPTPRGPRAQAIADAWGEWCLSATVDGATSWHEWQRLVLAASISSGDVLVYWPRRQADKMGTRVDAIDASRVLSPTDGRAECTHGVVRDEAGAVVAYHVAAHGVKSPRLIDLTSYPRDIDGHPYARLFMAPSHKQPRQSRGVPLFASAILRAKDLDSLVRAEVRSANTRSRVAGVLRSPDPKQMADMMTYRMQHGEEYGALFSAFSQRRIMPMGDAAIVNLGVGEDMTLTQPTSTSSSLASFTDAILREIAQPTGVPHRVLFRVLGDASYSAARSDLLIARAVYRRWRAAFIHTVLAPTYRRVLADAYAAGLLGHAPITREEVTPEWTPPREEWIDPAKEAVGWEKQVALGLVSVPQLARELGRDAYATFSEQANYLATREARR